MNSELPILNNNSSPLYIVGKGEALYSNSRIAISISSRDETFRTTIDLGIANRVQKLLTIAINNRTRQMNYFRLYCDLLDGTISEEDFDREVKCNEDKYVVAKTNIPSMEDFILSSELAKDLMDVEDVEDLSNLFSFRSKEVHTLANHFLNT